MTIPTNCPKCGALIKTVPAGVSKKTGRPYNAFQCCSNRECDWKPMRTGASSGSVSTEVLTLLNEIKSIVLLINSKMPKPMPAINLDADPISEEEDPF